ncbi:hypothetical protein JL720_1116 [Aureococcus anophagefferens]|nr:hypothetical protein JL720_1116 [Aureococcus anophagefferens]
MVLRGLRKTAAKATGVHHAFSRKKKAPARLLTNGEPGEQHEAPAPAPARAEAAPPAPPPQHYLTKECGAFGDPAHGPCDGAPARGRWTWRRHADPASPGAPGRTLRGSMANTYGTATLLRRGGETVVASDGDPVAVSQMGAWTWRHRARARSAREGRLVRCHTLIDLDGLSVLVAARCIRKILPPIAKVAQQYYPEVNSSNTAINAPMGVESLWRIVQLFIDENMRQKVRIVGRSYRGALVDHAKIADLAKLARRHGGDVPDAELLPACPPIPQGFRELVDADPTPPFLQDIIS